MRIVGFIPTETNSVGNFNPPDEEINSEDVKKTSRRGKRKKEEKEDADNGTGISETQP